MAMLRTLSKSSEDSLMEPGLLTIYLHPSDADTPRVLKSDPDRRAELRDIGYSDARSGTSRGAWR